MSMAMPALLTTTPSGHAPALTTTPSADTASGTAPGARQLALTLRGTWPFVPFGQVAEERMTAARPLGPDAADPLQLALELP